eukprot:CAMPEP_0178449910 /NCGR_PEP_ID=MMETSP0689_2-20121128/42825_1 /TAXON_ID=160604 /ORGANISM="Amphidinium massartii, Strain CS-259" /LENGTH=101 /DNA_ID=CAMNT_0020075305 /DNA_START=263 /DNA_END=569 /DNA_ORIENTATION=+
MKELPLQTLSAAGIAARKLRFKPPSASFDVIAGSQIDNPMLDGTSIKVQHVMPSSISSCDSQRKAEPGGSSTAVSVTPGRKLECREMSRACNWVSFTLQMC